MSDHKKVCMCALELVDYSNIIHFLVTTIKIQSIKKFQIQIRIFVI